MLSKDYQDHCARNKGPGTGKIYKLLPHNLHIIQNKTDIMQ